MTAPGPQESRPVPGRAPVLPRSGADGGTGAIPLHALSGLRVRDSSVCFTFVPGTGAVARSILAAPFGGWTVFRPVRARPGSVRNLPRR
ncbi:hypothetical protein [Streptomyces sp. NPDC094472]|uniref:hypothetical protein n=1 Tax=Streptomyces sp. NPDC094472 TaxID=3155080 RepID=UPI003330190B